MSRWGLKGKQGPPPAVGNRRKVYRERGQRRAGKAPLLSLLFPLPARFNGPSLFLKWIWWFLFVLVVVFVARGIVLPVAILFPSLPDCYCHCNCARAVSIARFVCTRANLPRAMTRPCFLSLKRIPRCLEVGGEKEIKRRIKGFFKSMGVKLISVDGRWGGWGGEMM